MAFHGNAIVDEVGYFSRLHGQAANRPADDDRQAVSIADRQPPKTMCLPPFFKTCFGTLCRETLHALGDGIVHFATAFPLLWYSAC
jgi:hypothetical protein